MLHIQQEERRAVYDPFMGSFLTPDWLHSRKNIHQPEMFLLYRINGNDPLIFLANLTSSVAAQSLKRGIKVD